MKLVINTCYGGFDLPDEVLEELGYSNAGSINIRGDLRLIKMIEENPERLMCNFAKLEVVEIPDTATDYMIDDYDGMESVLYVLNGKIKYV